MHPKRKTFLLWVLIANAVLLTATVLIPSPLGQGIAIVSVFAINVLGSAVFGLFTKRRLVTYVQTLSIFLAILFAATAVSSAVSSLLSSHGFYINREIAQIKKTSEEVLSTDCADVYFDSDDMVLYTVLDLFGSKYINKGVLVPTEKSSFHQLYNLGMEIQHEIEEVEDIFVYPPTPATSGELYYLVEMSINGEFFVARVFLPGNVSLSKNASSHLFTIGYGSNNSQKYEVSRIDRYLLFQGNSSSFSTPFTNVAYHEDEYFFVRYNRYLRVNGLDEPEIDETNVKFVNSISVGIKSIDKVSFFVISEQNGDESYTIIPVMEIVYTDGTSDVAVIRDINAAAIRDVG